MKGISIATQDFRLSCDVGMTILRCVVEDITQE